MILGATYVKRRSCWWPAPTPRCRFEAPFSGEEWTIVDFDDHDVILEQRAETGGIARMPMPHEELEAEWQRQEPTE